MHVRILKQLGVRIMSPTGLRPYVGKQVISRYCQQKFTENNFLYLVTEQIEYCIAEDHFMHDGYFQIRLLLPSVKKVNFLI